MGREVKRVPMDFNWPVGKTWYGYLIGKCITDKEEEDGCETCRRFAKIKGRELSTLGCPKYPEFEPPIGDGWQMWETVSEGSPISPVFATPEELARWLADTGASACGFQTASYESWLSMIMSGWAPSGIIINGKCMSGVEGVAYNNEEQEESR